MADRCSMKGCAETAAVALEQRQLCCKHFLAHSYARLASITTQVQQADFHEVHADGVAGFLEECMRDAAEIACSAAAPDNLERAQVLDVLLWASELHGRLRRGSRVPANIPILVRSVVPERSWEEITATRVLSQRGVRFTCRHDVRVNDTLLCIRLDTQGQIQARVVWTRGNSSGGVDVGVEFTTDEDFWGLGPAKVANSRDTP
jgi:hypothetical protein